MSIDVKRFVDVNIKAHVASVGDGTRDTVVLYSNEGSSSTPIDVDVTDYTTKCAGMTSTLAYLKVYFDNGGIKARVIGQTAYATLDISGLDDKYIVVAYAAPTSSVEAVYAALKTVATTRAADATVYGVNQKIIVARTTVNSDTDSVKNFAVKYSTVLGAEMAIAAYLCKQNVYRADSIYDYMYTQEVLTAEDLTDANYAVCLANNMNVDVYLAGAVRNCGGNCKDGADLINNFCLIVLHQTVTDVILSLLTQKIKNVAGVSKIYSVMSQELSRYVTSGYLTTDKVWTANDWVVNYNSQNFTIIEKGTALDMGYQIRILPLSALTDADKAAHKAPPIYIAIADQYGIRIVTINGEVI